MYKKEQAVQETTAAIDVEQPDINNLSISQKNEKCKWLSSENKINEPLFCTDFCANKEYHCINNQFYSIDGIESEEKIKAKIANVLQINGVVTNIARRVSALYETLKYHCYSAPVTPEEDKIHLLNGFLNTKGNFIPKKTFCINRLNISFDAQLWNNPLKPEKFIAFLNELLEPEDILTLQEYLGYCLIPSTKAQTALFIIGNGGEGKSRIGVVLKEIFADSMITGDFHRIDQDKFFRYNLADKLLMNDDDMRIKALKSTSYIKNIITSEIPIDIEAKNRQSHQKLLYCRFICFGNGSPRALHDKSDGFTRRLLILTTKRKAQEREDNPFLVHALIEEKFLIFKWMFEGLQRLIENNFKFTVSKKTKANISDAVSDNCNIIDFLKENAIFQADEEISSVMLYEAYLSWCDDNALTALKKETFTSWLKSNEEKYKIVYSNSVNRSTKRVRGFKGLTIRSEQK